MLNTCDLWSLNARWDDFLQEGFWISRIVGQSKSGRTRPALGPRSGTLTIVGRHRIFSSNTIGPSQGKVTGMWGTLISKSSCKRSGTSIMVVSSSLSIGSGISAKRKKRRWPKWPTPARVLHGSCTEDMVVLLQTELPYIECQPASAFWWQCSLLSVLLDCNQTARLLTTSSIPLYKRANFCIDFLIYDHTTGKTPVLVLCNFAPAKSVNYW